MKKWIEQIKTKIKDQEFDYKQMFLGVIILIVAIIFLVLAFHSEEKNMSQTDNALSKLITNKLNKDTRSNRVSNIISNDNFIKEKEGNVILNFETVTERDMEYKIYYTTKNSAPFDEKNVVLYKGQKGSNKYNISLPVKQIARFRIQLEPQAGNVTFKNIYLTGSQQAELNRFEQYEFSQIENIKVNEDKSISFLSRSTAPSLVYYPSLMPAEEDERTEETTTSETE